MIRLLLSSACAAVFLVGTFVNPAQAQSPAVDAGSLDGALPISPGVSGETFDPVLDRLPDDGFGWLRDLDKNLADLKRSGYPGPDDPKLNGYDTLTLEALAAKLNTIGDPCEQAVFAKLYLDAHQDNLGPHNAAALATDLIWIKIWPNDPAKADMALKWLGGHVVPGLAQWAMAKDIKAAFETVMDYADGTWAGWKGRWGLGVYEQSRAENWSPERIAEEERQRHEDLTDMQADSNRLLSEFESVSTQKQAAFQQQLNEMEARLAQLIAEIDAKEAAQSEEELRNAQVRDRNFEPPGLSNYPVSQREDDRDLENRLRQEYLDEVLADPKAWYQAQRNDLRNRMAQQKRIAQLQHDAAMAWMAKGYNDKLAEALDEMIELRAEAHALKTYAAPVAAGNCDDLREVEPIATEAVEEVVIDRISTLSDPRFKAVMASLNAVVPASFNACLCASLVNSGAGGGWKLDGGVCYGIGVLGGSWKVDMTGGDNHATWEACLEKVRVPTAQNPDGMRMQDIVVERLRTLPGNPISGGDQLGR